MIFKIAFEKSVRKFNFTKNTEMLYKCIESFIYDGNVGIKVNGYMSSYFQMENGFSHMIHYLQYYLR